jgi:uncharacterized membrane protein
MDDKENNPVNQDDTHKQSSSRKEPVWTYRGYRIRPGEFNTAMVHLYRGEVTRANTWRSRLDATTNWAVVTTGATTSIAFSQAHGHHSVLLLNMFLVTLFLFIEARRYRYYELWSSRIRLMETDFFAGMLVPPFRPAWDWAETLADNLLHPSYPISMWEAFGRRFRRNYLWIYLIVAISWMTKLWLHPIKAPSWRNILSRAAVGGLTGPWVFALVGLFLGAMFLIGILTIRLHQASGEVLPQFEDGEETEGQQERTGSQGLVSWFRPSSSRDQYLTYIVTSSPSIIAQKIMDEMRRGVTGLNATGMYTGEEKSMLICALTDTEISHLKNLVHETDPEAFVIVSPAKGVVGKGFEPFDKEDI